MKIKSTVNNPQSPSYLLRPVNFKKPPINLQDITGSLPSKIPELQPSYTKIENQLKESEKDKHLKNTDSLGPENSSTKMDCYEDQILSTNKKSSVNRNLSENFSHGRKKQRPRTYSISDHISQMSTWQNSLISEFGMLPTLPCIPYFSVVDSSDDECHDVSCNESIIFTHNLHTETLNDNMSNLMLSDENSPKTHLKMHSLNTEFPKAAISLLSNHSKYLKATDVSQHNDTKSSKTIVSLKSADVDFLQTMTSKKRFKFKFPKIKLNQKYNQDDFTKIIIPARHNNLGSPKIRIVSQLHGHDIGSNFIQNSNSNIKLDALSGSSKSKIRKEISSTFSIKQENINVKNQGFFRKFIFKNLKKNKIFKNKETQTYISMVDDFVSYGSQLSKKHYLQDIFRQTESVNSYNDIHIFDKLKAIYSTQKTDLSRSRKSSLTTPKYFIDESIKQEKEIRTGKNITSEIDTFENQSSKQSMCYCTCTCLCGACCTVSKTKHALKRPSSVVFVEIAASRKNVNCSDTLDFGEDFDDKIATSTNITHMSDDSLNKK